MLDGLNPQAEPNHFVDPDTNRRVNVGEAANFLNDYFCNISTRLSFDAQAPFNEDFKIDVDEAYSGVDAEFCLLSDPFVLDELEYCIDSIDISKSSSVLNISTFVCRDFMRAFVQHMLHILNTSIPLVFFPRIGQTLILLSFQNVVNNQTCRIGGQSPRHQFLQKYSKH